MRWGQCCSQVGSESLSLEVANEHRLSGPWHTETGNEQVTALLRRLVTLICCHMNRPARSSRDLQRSCSLYFQADLKLSRYLKPLTYSKPSSSGKLGKDLPWVDNSTSPCSSAVMSFPLCGYRNPYCGTWKENSSKTWQGAHSQESKQKISSNWGQGGSLLMWKVFS